MTHLSETQRLGISILIGRGDETRTHQEVCDLFSRRYPDRLINLSTVSKIEKKFRETVWAGIVRDKLIGPFFFEKTMRGQNDIWNVRNGLMSILIEMFPNVNNPQTVDDNIYGAPPHFAQPVREYLNNDFPERWIGRRGPIEWPPRSPDLAPLDCFFYGYLKSKVT